MPLEFADSRRIASCPLVVYALELCAEADGDGGYFLDERDDRTKMREDGGLRVVLGSPVDPDICDALRVLERVGMVTREADRPRSVWKVTEYGSRIAAGIADWPETEDGRMQLPPLKPEPLPVSDVGAGASPWRSGPNRYGGGDSEPTEDPESVVYVRRVG